MSRPESSGESGAGSLSPQQQSLLFARLVLQLADLANVMMGRVPNPSTGETVHDLEAARMFVDQLAMLECKTQGNLLPEESRLLRDTLMNLRLAFVEAVEKSLSSSGAPGTSAANQPESPRAFSERPEGSPSPSATNAAKATPPDSAENEEASRRRFFKKYDV
ncbi:MAG: DUF1844 domain-containing protein [Verrucomicrobiota bacterium]|nr:DUF1844 domain-containing protein [Limisphaera sp.]MDW8381822.1 DUF1844 domain-containing protein [Verrucomicrobiota bacterium]